MQTSRYLRAGLLGLLFIALIAGSAAAQNPNSCTTSGFSSYSYTTEYNAGNNTTTLTFTFCNESPIGGKYVNIGEIFFDGLPDPVDTSVPNSGWEFKSVGPKNFFATTSSPWWETPPAIPPGECLNSFTYTINGAIVPPFVVFTHVQSVSDATGQEEGPYGTWFDCSVLNTPPVDEPCISVDKSVDPDEAAAGDMVTYSIRVCNCGNVGLTVTTVEDTILGDLLDEFQTANGGSDALPADTCVTFQVQYQIPDNASGLIENCVSVAGETDDQTEVTDEDCAVVVITPPEDEPCISINKTATPTEILPGGTVTYIFEVCNCGNVTLTVTSLTDTILGDLLDEFKAENADSDSLPIGACVTFQVEYDVPVETESPLENCAEVTGETPDETEVTDEDCASVVITPPADEPCISIDKVATPVQVPPEGTVTYTFTVCNCGNTDLTVTSLTDTVLGDLLDEFKAENGASAELPEGNCVQFQVEYDIPAGTPSPLENCATVEAEVTADDGLTVTDTDCALVVITQQGDQPCISLEKRAFPPVATYGQTVYYQYTVCNCGDVPLTITSFEDSIPAIGDLLPLFIDANNGSALLLPGICVEICAQYVIPPFTSSPLFNCATVVGEPPTGPPVSITFCARVDISRFPIPIQCFLPVTFSQQALRVFGNPCVPVVPCIPNGTTIFDRFSLAFNRFKFGNLPCPNEIMIGDPRRCCVMFTGSTFGLHQLWNFFPQTGPFTAKRLFVNQTNPGALVDRNGAPCVNIMAGELLALMINVAYNDARIMPRTAGVDLENFVVTQGPCKGRNVRWVINAANAVLAGASVTQFGLPASTGWDCLVNVIRRINANYEFQGFGSFVDRGFLKPDKSVGVTKPPHPFTLP